MFDVMNGSILSFHDIDDYFNEETPPSESSPREDVAPGEYLFVYAYRNDSGRPICFEDIRECEEYEVKDYQYARYNPDDKDLVCPEEGEGTPYKKLTYFHHPKELKSYVLKPGGYMLIEDIELECIMNSNPILQKIIEKGLMSKCDFGEAKAYLDEKRIMHEADMERRRALGYK